MADQFSIGKRGPTIYQGSANPSIGGQAGSIGDLYVQLGSTPTLYQFRSNGWVDITGEIFTRTAVTTAHYSAASADLYLGVRFAGPCTIQLPTGTFGKKYIVKDEIGSASPTNPIYIAPSGNDTIDGATQATIDTARSSLTFVYGVEWHIL